MMKSFLYIIVGILMLYSCSEDNAVSPAPAEYNFEFKELNSDKRLFSVKESVKLTSVAVGEGLSYKWQADQGFISGSGAQIYFTICHADNSIITCTVSDKYGNTASLRKTVVSYFPVDSVFIGN